MNLKKGLPFKIERKERIYSLRQKLNGKGDLGIQMIKFQCPQQNSYKLIKLNLVGIAQGKKARIKKVVKNVNYYSGNGTVPDLIYNDEKSIVLKWIDGTVFSKAKINQELYENLAEFNAKNFICIKKLPINNTIKERKKWVAELLRRSELSDNVAQKLNTLFESSDFTGGSHIYEALGFADTATKNYLIKENSNELVYIDVFGIDTRSIGRVYLKQLSQIPKNFRHSYSIAFKKNIPVDLSSTLNFSYLDYLITRIYSNVTKRTFRDYRYRKRKSQLAIKDLETFLQIYDKGISAEECIISGMN
jgi:hypothetical protein